jgi:PadR family transcriptional regulator PadR
MKFERELLKGVAPMAVLELLAREPMYGYQLTEQLSLRSGEIFTMGRGTLYPLLYNLEAKGYVKPEEREAESGRRRRYYIITDKGRKQLAASRAEWEKLQEGLGNVFGSVGSKRRGNA